MNNAVENQIPYQPKFPVCDLKSRDDPHYSTAVYGDPIWNIDRKKYKPGIFGLHEEIKNFLEYISPTPEEYWVREIVIAKVKNIIFRLWPDCRIDVFGSFSTGLFLPTSDIDMVIFGKWETLPLRTLENALRMSGHVSEIKVLSRATVPIVKLTDVDTGLHVDISFNMINSVHAAAMIREYIRIYPCLPPLVFVLKQFLLQRDLNEVWTGGISSYALILMSINFLQNTVKKDTSYDDINLGTLLVEFFELYGHNFNYMTTGIRIRGNGAYVRKEVIQMNMEPGCRPSMLCIEDPLCPANDVGRRSYGVLQVKQAFEHAYLALCSALRPEGNQDNSILSRIIQLSPLVEECRLRIKKHAQQLYRILPHLVPPIPMTVKSVRQQVNPPKTHISTSLSGNSSNVGSATQSTKSSEQSNASSASNKEPIIISARGFSAQPPSFLRESLTHNVLNISTHLSQFVYPQQTILYDANSMLQMVNFPRISVSSTSSKPVFLYINEPFHHTPGHAFAPVISNVDCESTAMSQGSPGSDSDDNLMLDIDISQQKNKNIKDVTKNSSPSETRKKNRDIQQESTDRNKTCRSSSAVNPCSSLICRLAPLRLASSDQNVAYNAEGRSSTCEHSDSMPTESPSHEYADSSSNEVSIEVALIQTKEKPAKSVSGSKMHSKSKNFRRCQRTLRRGNNVAFVSNEESETSADLDPNNINGFSLKRRCSQLHDTSTRIRQNQSIETTSSNEKLPSASTIQQPSGQPKAWFPVKESVRTVTYNSSKSDDHGCSQADPQHLSKSNLRNKTSKKVTAPPTLKRLATDRPR